MDRAFRDSGVLDGRVGDIMSPTLPMVGIGEPIPKLVQYLERATAVLVLDGGHPVGLLSRSDVLGFLAVRSPDPS